MPSASLHSSGRKKTKANKIFALLVEKKIEKNEAKENRCCGTGEGFCFQYRSPWKGYSGAKARRKEGRE